MTFNILLIDEDSTLQDFKILLSNAKEYHLSLASDYTHLKTILHEEKIHLILLNTNTCSFTTLEKGFDENNIAYDRIPIIILEEEFVSQKEHESLLIFDHVNLKSSTHIIFNKIKFCQHLYKKELEHEYNIKKLLYTDDLTKLPNRTKLIQDIQNDEIGIDALAIIDIKSFKELNDFFGHRIGDNILKSVVMIINDIISFVQDKVTLYKFPADEYCLANHGLAHKDFQNIVVYILGGIKSQILKEDGHEIDIDATAGITFSPKNNKLVTAGLALQEAKRQYKAYIVFYEELDKIQEYESNMLWTRKLKRALDKDNITVYYQPLINNQTKKVDKYECLVRLYDDEEDKIVSPFFFLELSKKASQYKNITKIVIEKSFQTFANLEFEFSINVSYEDIDNSSFLLFIEDRLKKYNVAPRVVWEILEDESIKDYAVLINFINRVKELGCKVAIDDFGSGYSNFEHILKMNVDYLKIDASLIKNVVTDENSYKVVKTVIDFAKSLQIKTIAEFVENEAIFDITRELGVDFSQGYYFSAPIESPKLKQF